MSIFTYQLTEQQFNRFVTDPNTTGEIDNLARMLGTNVTEVDPSAPYIAQEWQFSGACYGQAWLTTTPSIRINVRKKPWYLPDFVLDWGFKRALK